MTHLAKASVTDGNSHDFPESLSEVSQNWIQLFLHSLHGNPLAQLANQVISLPVARTGAAWTNSPISAGMQRQIPRAESKKPFIWNPLVLYNLRHLKNVKNKLKN